jgi:hypothetical protein
MDYARFNYVAQPEDNIGEKGIYPRINDYDKWAIEWGYRLFPDIKSAKAEEPFLNKWIIDSISHNHRLWYGPQPLFFSFDPRSQNEDLGDDAMKAGAYGIMNLKRILQHLPEWTHRPNQGYGDLKTMYNELLAQFSRYAGHVASNISGWYLESKSVEEKGELYVPVPATKQRQAVAWLQEQVFKTPVWLQYHPVTVKAEDYFSNSAINVVGTKTLAAVINVFHMEGLLRAAELYGDKQVYTCAAFLSDMKRGIWSELITHTPIDAYRRELQDTYVNILTRIVAPESAGKTGSQQTASELLIVVKPHLAVLKSAITAAIPVTTDATSKAHLQLMEEKIKQALDPKTRY